MAARGRFAAVSVADPALSEDDPKIRAALESLLPPERDDPLLAANAQQVRDAVLREVELQRHRVYHGGWPTTRVDVQEIVLPNGDPGLQAIVGERNGERLGAFARIDARVSRRAPLGNGVLTYYFEVYNLLNRDNPCCVDNFDVRTNSDGSPRLEPEIDYWLPLLPSFGIQYEF